MRWCPEKEDEGERQRHRAELRVAGACAGKHCPTAGEPAENDVHPCAPLQPDRVDDGVEEGAEKNEECRPGVQRQPRCADGDNQQGDDDQQPDWMISNQIGPC